MQKVDLKKIKPTPHPASAIFKKNQIPLSAIATAVNLSYGHVCSILSGIRPATPEIDSKLSKLAESLEGGNDG